MTSNLILSVFHCDGSKMSHRARFSTKQARDEAAAMVLSLASGDKTVIVGPDCDGASLALPFDEIKALHIRVENPPEMVAVEGKEYREVAGCLYPSKWFKQDEVKFAIN